MSQELQIIGQLAATTSAQLTNRLALETQMVAPDAMTIAVTLAGPPIMVLAGLTAKSFVEGETNIHPALCATDDNILFACLLISRSFSRIDGGKHAVSVTPDTITDALADFAKLRPLVSAESIVRVDMLDTAREGANAGNAMLSGILSKRLS